VVQQATESEAAGSVMRHRPFRLFWFSRSLATLSFQALAVAVAWQVYSLSGRAIDLGYVGLAQFLPMFLLTLPAGQLADRFDRRRIIACCQTMAALGALVLAAGSLGGWLSRAEIYGTIALIGAARAVEAPTLAALLPGLVPRALVPRASAWSASANQTAQICGPALGGLLLSFGAEVVFATAMVGLCAAAACAASIPRGPQPAREPVFLASVLSGIGFVRRHAIVLGSISLDLFAVLLGATVALLPIFARDILGTGPWGLGVLRASPALGALAMSIWLANRPLHPPVGRTLFTFGVATCVFALSRHLALSMTALAVAGAADVVSVVIRFSLVQLNTPDEMRGRVSAVNALFVGTSNQLGEFRAGLAASLFGAVPAALLGGLATMAVAALWMRLFPALRRLDRLED
jgi:MFS family permease